VTAAAPPAQTSVAVKRHETGLTVTVDDDDGDDDYAEADAVPYDSYEPVPPFVFVGLTLAEDAKGNPLKDRNGRPFGAGPRAVDGRGVSVPNPELEIYRWRAHADAEGDPDGAARSSTIGRASSTRRGCATTPGADGSRAEPPARNEQHVRAPRPGGRVR
jgi:hypothetical protein